jgi:Ser/Thr protein kinase RdoA (MazF antagonist)
VSVVPREPDAGVLARAFRLWGAEAGIPDGTPELLGGSSCRVYALGAKDAGRVLRLTLREPGRARQARLEVDWLGDLARRGAPVCAPVPSVRGRSLEFLRDGRGRGYLASAFRRARGVAVTSLQPEVWTPALFELCGGTLGEIHALGKDFRPRFGLRRYRWSGPGLVRLARRVLPVAERGVVARIERCCRTLARLPRDRDGFGLVHGDFHQGNYRLDAGRLEVFDFGGCSYCWYAYDIAASVYASLLERVHRGEEDLERHAREYLVPFLRGYLRAHPLAPVWIEPLADFLRLFNLSVFLSFFRSPARPGRRISEFVGARARGDEPCLDLDFARLYQEARRPREERGVGSQPSA